MNWDKLQLRFSRLLRRPACKQSGPGHQGNDKRELNKKQKYKRNKLQEAKGSKW